MEDVETDNALEGEELEEHIVRGEFGLHVAIEAEDGHDSNRGEERFENGDPDVCEVDAVRLCAIDPGSHGDAGGDPDDETDRYELKDRVPGSLNVCQT